MIEPDAPRHVSVLLDEAIAGLALEPDGYVVDCTFGRGGHSRAILDRLGPAGRLLALDKDPDAIASPEAEALLGDPRFELEHAGFAELKAKVAMRGGLGRVSGVLMDLGVSSPQLEEPERGFSFSRNGPLDMRMNVAQGETAAEWLSRVSESELASVLRDYGEERFARRIARAIMEARARASIHTTGELARVIEDSVPTREQGKHPATRSFQAIRIVVNRELDELEAALRQAVEVLGPGGRLAVISFHSLEDRMVKRFMRDQERGGKPEALRRLVAAPAAGLLRRIGKAIMAGAEEVRRNPRARSAVLRVAERVAV